MENIKFGSDGLMLETPLWAKWIFRITALLTTAIAFVVAGDPMIPDMLKIRILLYLKGIDIVVLGLSKMVGVQPEAREQTGNQDNNP